MLLTQQLLTTHSVAFTLSPDCYKSTLVLDDGREVLITEEMVERACRAVESSFYPLHMPKQQENPPPRKLRLVL